MGWFLEDEPEQDSGWLEVARTIVVFLVVFAASIVALSYACPMLPICVNCMTEVLPADGVH